VVLYSLETLSRDLFTLLALEKLFNEYDVELHTVEGQIDTSTPDGFLSFAMKAFLGEMERRQIKWRTKKAQHKKARGEVVGSISYGYVRGQGGTVIPNLEEQKVIALAISLYRDNPNLSEVCRTLDRMGCLSRSGKPFRPEQIKRIIPDYAGQTRKLRTTKAASIRTCLLDVA